jgi:hypothetical protein
MDHKWGFSKYKSNELQFNVQNGHNLKFNSRDV